MDPTGAHGTDTLLLRQMEYDLRMWHWANTKAAEDESTKPEPILLDGEQEAIDRRIDQQKDAAVDIARQLGLAF